MAGFTIDAAHPCLPGHFPGRPLVPGVVILDRVVAAIEAQHGPLGALRLPQVKFVQPLLPDVTAEIEIAPQPAGADAGDGQRWRFRVTAGDTLLASGEVVSQAPAMAAAASTAADQA